MSDNTKIWDEFKHTDPKFTKGFKRAGGFEGTAVNPTWQLRRMTELFGPCGLGWYYEIADTRTHESQDGHIIVYRDVNLFIKRDDEWSRPIHGSGGDFIVGKNKYGLHADDEAYKKAETDALGNAMKKLGIGADVHMGMFDDNKYVNDMRAKFGEQRRGGKEESKNNDRLPRPATTDEVDLIADEIAAANSPSTFAEAQVKARALWPRMDEVQRKRVSALVGDRKNDFPETEKEGITA